ncbi:serine/threonine-protein kinase 4-like [Bolinopsis microptera]|uniref:serine/threonine-protein kinase 4-like n=1 Tax=Bolinopsis microptera TaxID=2820187 RepID=UPI00307A56FF
MTTGVQPKNCVKCCLPDRLNDFNVNIPVDFFDTPEDFFQFLARGSYGKVYKHQDSIGRETVAIKVPFKNNATLFLEEIEKHKTFAHPHIVHYIMAHKCINTDKYHIIMEYMENSSLETKLSTITRDVNSRTIPVLRTVSSLKYIEHILKALVYLHNEMKFIHRDLRAANVLLDANDVAKLADFGITKCVSETSSLRNTDAPSSKVGNYLWCGPEILLDKKEHKGFNEDIWSLGIVILEMVFHQPDFFGAYGLWSQQADFIKVHKSGGFRQEVLEPLLTQISSRDIRTLLKECLIDNVPDRKTSSELLQLVEKIRVQRRSSSPVLPYN